MSWETFDKRKSNANDMTISVQKTNKMSVSEAVVKELGAEYVELLYDREANRMALRPATKESPVAYKVRKASRQNSWSVSLISFIKYYSLEHVVVQKRFRVFREGDLFVVDLNQPIA